MKLIGLDLDGTVLNSKGELTEEVAEALKKADSTGEFKIVFCTGRPLSGIKQILLKTQMKSSSFHVLCNGALVESWNGERLYRQGLTLADLNSVYDFCKKKNISLIAVDDRKVYTMDKAINLAVIKFCYLTNNEILYREVETFTDKDIFLKLMICEKEEIINHIKGEILNIFSKKFNCVQGDAEFIEFSPLTVSKGSALAKVAEYYNIEKEKVYVVGDNENDVSMFEEFPHSIAMGNAVNRLKEKSKWICSTNDENGVVEALEIVRQHN